MTSPKRTFLLTFLGLMVIETLWILVVPPFRGIDEFEHAYRAAEVAHGEWRPDYVAAVHGRGELVTVPRDIVAAAHLVCSRMPYTGVENCNPVADSGGQQMVQVASAAARYNPLFYWVVGTAALPFHGDAALYAMRTASALMSALILALAFTIAIRDARTWWPATALLVAVTPMVTYTCSLPAPNGVEMASGLLCWVTLLSLARPDSRHTARRLWLLFTAAASILVTVRTLGPLWLALILASWLVLVGGRRAREVLFTRDDRTVVAAAVLVVSLAGVAAVLWSVLSRTNTAFGTDVVHDTGPVTPLLPTLVPWWLLQSIGVFPTLVERAPTALYAFGGLAYVALTLVALPAWRRFGWRAALFVAVMGAAVPLAATIATFSTVGLVWQGRYSMPFTMGFFLLAGCALDTTRRLESWQREACWLAASISAAATVTALLGTLSEVGGDEPYPTWVAPPMALVVSATLAAYAMVASALALDSRRLRRSDRSA